MSMKILVIHEFRVTLKIVRNYLMTECENIGEVTLCASPVKAMELLASQKFDLIFSGLEMTEANGLTLHSQAIKTQANQDTPFVILTSNASEKQYQRLSGCGIQYVLPMPFTPDQLRTVVAAACDPRRYRAHKRYAIAQTRARIAIQQTELPADVLNISANGILCELAVSNHQINLLDIALLSVKFPGDFDDAEVNGIRVSPVRVDIQTWDENERPLKILTAWRFIDCPEPCARSLSQIFEKADLEMRVLKTESRY